MKALNAGILDFWPFAKQRISFVEKQNGIAALCLMKDLAQILLCFPNVLANHAGEINLVEI